MSQENDAFKAIKLLEAFCNLRWTMLGSDKRPEIPLSPEFKIHLQNARQDLHTMFPPLVLDRFFGLVLSEKDPKMVGVMSGSFRH
jgi:hypothetical protein